MSRVSSEAIPAFERTLMLNGTLVRAASPQNVVETRVIGIPSGTTQATIYPSSISDAPTAIVLPAMGVPARAYARTAAQLAVHGVNVVAIELRGIGASSVTADGRNDWGYLDLVDHEVEAAVATAADVFPVSRRFFVGHSLGGHLALLHQARYPERDLAGTFLVASGSPYARMYGLAMRPVVSALAMLIDHSLRRHRLWRGDRLRFGGVQPYTLMREWASFTRTGKLVPHGEWNAERALAALNAPIVALAMSGDRYAPSSAIRHLAAKTSGPVWHESVAVTRIGRAPGHFAWLRDPETAVCSIVANLFKLGLSRSPCRVSR